MSGQTPEQEVDPALCKHEHTEMGYGLAGGGIGVYEYCTECYTILHKTQDQEMLEPRGQPASSIFNHNNCSYCWNGTRPCRQGNHATCSNPIAKNH